MHLEIGHHQASARIAEEQRPCLYLWAEVFRVALADARGEGTRAAGLSEERWELRRRVLSDSATQWFSDEDLTPGSFLWCCSLFNLDPDVVRAQVKRREKNAP